MSNILNKNKILRLAEKLRQLPDEEAKICYLQNFLPSKSTSLVELSLLAIGQEHLLPLDEEESYLRIERFYAPLGGLVGYHAAFLEHLEPVHSFQKEKIRKAEGPDLRQSSYLEPGIEAIEKWGEIYPVGGLGTRLDFRDERGELLPVALLPFGGYSLLEGLVRDVEAREDLYYQRFGKKVTIPVALMTSEENERRLLLHCEERAWFGRGRENFKLFPQLMVPVVTKEGIWTKEREPGGHGALWLTAEKAKVFDWFLAKGKEHLLIRQINNPLAAIDDSLLSFVGYGVSLGKTFGFASCDRHKGAAEGVLVLHGEKTLCNIEYTDLASGELPSDFPANTNILYAHIPKIQKVIHQHPFGGLMVNMKEKNQGRLESMMQSISHYLPIEDVFITYNARARTISSTKRKFEGKELLETPEGAFFVQQKNAHELLTSCGCTLPPFREEEDFLRYGPATLFRYTPKLGPLYALIRKKIKNCTFAEDAELVVELADLLLENVHLEGSLLIEGKGKCHLKNVKIKNLGRRSTHYSGETKREEALVLHVDGELILENLVLEGGRKITADGV